MNTLFNKKDVKLAVCIPCLFQAGSEIATLQMVKALMTEGCQIELIVYFEYAEDMVKEFEETGAKVTLLKLKRRGISSLIILLYQLYKCFTKQGFDAVHVQYFAPGMVPVLAARLARVKNIFATVHAAGSNGYKLKSKMMLRISSFLSDHFFCVSKNVEKFWFGKNCILQEGNITKHSVIYNGIDTELFSNAERKIIGGISENDFVIGIAGRIVPLKGHACLLKAFSMLLPRFKNLKLLVVGDGEYRSELVKLSESLNISNYIIWAGEVKHDMIGDYYKSMDLAVMPSRWEGFGLTAAEAMACSVPVIGTKVPGLVEVIGENSKSGILFEVDAYEELSRCVEKLYKDKEPRINMGKNAYDRVKNNFSLEQNLKNWHDAYRILLSDKL